MYTLYQYIQVKYKICTVIYLFKYMSILNLLYDGLIKKLLFTIWNII